VTFFHLRILVEQGCGGTNNLVMELEKKEEALLGAARDWLRRGEYALAIWELDQIEGEKRSHPEVLMVRWQILAQTEDWEMAYLLAESIRFGTPVDPFWWYAAAFSLHRLGRTQAAVDMLACAPVSEGETPMEMLYKTVIKAAGEQLSWEAASESMNNLRS
jgi:hypothetical protein